MTITYKLLNGPWQSKTYYQNAKRASNSIHPSLEFIKNRYKGKKILEVACGEGTKLSNLLARYKVGVDISPTAIKEAQKSLIKRSLRMLLVCHLKIKLLMQY